MLEFTTIPASENALEGDWNDAVNNMLKGENISWQAGLNFKIVLGNRSARSQYEIAKYNYDKSQMDMARQRHSIRFSLESLLTDLDSAYKAWQASKAGAGTRGKKLADRAEKILARDEHPVQSA